MLRIVGLFFCDEYSDFIVLFAHFSDFFYKVSKSELIK